MIESGFAGILRQKRLAAGFTVKATAAKAAISRRTLLRWESGTSRPRVDELNRISAVLNVSATERSRLLDLVATPAALKALHYQDDDSFPASLPNKGDLLRALRLRRGYHQEELASQIGVSQATLARWEKGDPWPSMAVLHQICYVLQVHEEELAALTLGPFFPNRQTSGESPIGIEMLEERFSTVKRQLLEPYHFPLGNLYYLSLEADAFPLARQSDAGRFLLARILLAHAGYLGNCELRMESGRIALQALALLPTGEAWNDHRFYGEMFYTMWKYPMKQHARRLQPWVNRRLSAQMRSWLNGQTASSLIAQGDFDLVMDLIEQNYSLLLEDGGPSAAERYRWNHGQLLLNMGRPREAAEMLSLLDGVPPSEHLKTRILFVEAYLSLGDRSRAHNSLLEVISDVHTLGLDNYQPEINALMARL